MTPRVSFLLAVFTGMFFVFACGRFLYGGWTGDVIAGFTLSAAVVTGMISGAVMRSRARTAAATSAKRSVPVQHAEAQAFDL